MITSRRSFITGLTSLLVAPAIVRVGSIMPVKVVRPLTIQEIMYEAMKLFRNSNSFIDQIDMQYGMMFAQLNYETNDKIKIRLIPPNEIYIK